MNHGLKFPIPNLSKLEKWFFYLLLFSLPFQARIILRSWGIGFNEWNAVFLYGTDLLLIAVFLLWFSRLLSPALRRRHNDHGAKFIVSFPDLFLALFLVFSLISIINAANKPLGFFRFFKLIEFSLLYFYIKSNFSFKNSKEHPDSFISRWTSFKVLIYSGFLQGAIAITQFFKQASVGLKFLGESVIGPTVSNVAMFFVGNDLVLRAYGTTPHPNVLATFLFLLLFMFFFLYFDKKKDKVHWYDFLIYGAILWGFLFTFSRIIIFLFFLGIFLRFTVRILNKKIISSFWDVYKKRMALIVIVTIVLLGSFFFLFQDEIFARLSFSKESEAVALRLFYNKVVVEESGNILNLEDLFGIGLGNFVVWLKESGLAQSSYLLQPVHNIYLLILSEVGLFGLISFLLFLFFLALAYIKSADSNRITSYSFFIIFSSILLIGLFDHFLLTLQQGSLVLWLVLGFFGASARVKGRQQSFSRIYSKR